MHATTWKAHALRSGLQRVCFHLRIKLGMISLLIKGGTAHQTLATDLGCSANSKKLPELSLRKCHRDDVCVGGAGSSWRARRETRIERQQSCNAVSEHNVCCDNSSQSSSEDDRKKMSSLAQITTHHQSHTLGACTWPRRIRGTCGAAQR